MNKVVRWGIIGCGDVVERKVGNSFQSVPGSTLTAVMRRSADKAERFAERFKVDTWTTNPQEIIDNPEVDAVYVATPPAHHMDYALAVCEAGKPCLVEKPAGRSAAELQAMVDAFQAAGLPLFVSYYRRYLPKFRKVKEIIDSGKLGAITGITYRQSAPPPRNNWRSSAASSGGGLFFDVGGHVLDLFDDWFGEIELRSSTAANTCPQHDVEDTVSLAFRTPAGTPGLAMWNFAAPSMSESLTIEGRWGRLQLECVNCWKTLEVELRSTPSHRRRRPSLGQLVSRGLGGRKHDRHVQAETYRFKRSGFVHQPMIQNVVECIAAGGAGNGSASAALRASRLMDRALGEYYGGRGDAFWERPLTWASLRAGAARSVDTTTRQHYRLSEEEMTFFEENGYVGPFRCEASEIVGIDIPDEDTFSSPHREDPRLFAISTHPSIVVRVEQLMGSASGALLFKSRLRVKPPQSESVVPWHQDVGVRNGGYLPDGRPVQTMTAWLALGDITAENSALRVIPGSHRELYGDFSKHILAKLEETGSLDGVAMATAVELTAKAGEFYLFHSWLLHGSGPNASPSPRAILNMRYAPPGQDMDPNFEYIPLLTAERALPPTSPESADASKSGATAHEAAVERLANA